MTTALHKTNTFTSSPVAIRTNIRIDDMCESVQRTPELRVVTERERPLSANLRTELLSARQAVFRSSSVAEVDRPLRRTQLRSAEEEDGADRPDGDEADERPQNAVDSVHLRPVARSASSLQLDGRVSSQAVNRCRIKSDDVEPVFGRGR